jgi:anti-sigma regulatory factor (Ser/Thr protein kinase)
MTPHSLPRVAATLSDRLPDTPPAPDMPRALASAVLAGGIGERWFAIYALAPGMASPRAARDFTRRTLQAWGLEELTEDATVIVSELVTNAWRHGMRRDLDTGADPIELIFWQYGRELFCVVTDPGEGHPVLVAQNLCAEAGRGLRVIEALASGWGWSVLDAYRKAVWAALPVPAPGMIP